MCPWGAAGVWVVDPRNAPFVVGRHYPAACEGNQRHSIIIYGGGAGIGRSDNAVIACG